MATPDTTCDVKPRYDVCRFSHLVPLRASWDVGTRSTGWDPPPSLHPVTPRPLLPPPTPHSDHHTAATITPVHFRSMPSSGDPDAMAYTAFGRGGTTISSTHRIPYGRPLTSTVAPPLSPRSSSPPPLSSSPLRLPIPSSPPTVALLPL